MLLVAGLSLAACSTVQTDPPGTDRNFSTTGATKPGPAPRQTIVVRGEIVPDEPAVLPRRRAPVPAVAEDPAPAVDPGAAPVTDPVVENPPVADTPPVPITPPAATEPAAPAVDSAKPTGSLIGDLLAWVRDPNGPLQTPVGGMPLWLVGLLGFLALLALFVAFRGGSDSKREEPAFA